MPTAKDDREFHERSQERQRELRQVAEEIHQHPFRWLRNRDLRSRARYLDILGRADYADLQSRHRAMPHVDKNGPVPCWHSEEEISGT